MHGSRMTFKADKVPFHDHAFTCAITTDLLEVSDIGLPFAYCQRVKYEKMHNLRLKCAISHSQGYFLRDQVVI